MKKIGFLFGKEVAFSNDVMENILNKNIPEISVESIKIGIIDFNTKPDFAVILDRFSQFVPFYKSTMRFFEQKGTKVINCSSGESVNEEFLYLSSLKECGINVPNTAIFPSKMLPNGINGIDLQNLEYPLDWDSMFDTIGFPANVKSNNSIEFYDCYLIYNRQDFTFIYDMSGTNTLVLQECIDTPTNLRIFVVGKNKFFVNYELHKATKDRYSIADFTPTAKISKEIDKILEIINNKHQLDTYYIDVAITDKVYLLNISVFSMNINNMMIPNECYNWLVEETSNLLIDNALKNRTISIAIKKNAPTKIKTTKKATTSKKKSITK
jgi:hypothetical protein